MDSPNTAPVSSGTQPTREMSSEEFAQMSREAEAKATEEKNESLAQTILANQPKAEALASEFFTSLARLGYRMSARITYSPTGIRPELEVATLSLAEFAFVSEEKQEKKITKKRRTTAGATDGATDEATGRATPDAADEVEPVQPEHVITSESINAASLDSESGEYRADVMVEEFAEQVEHATTSEAACEPVAQTNDDVPNIEDEAPTPADVESESPSPEPRSTFAFPRADVAHFIITAKPFLKLALGESLGGDEECAAWRQIVKMEDDKILSTDDTGLANLFAWCGTALNELAENELTKGNVADILVRFNRLDTLVPQPVAA